MIGSSDFFLIVKNECAEPPPKQKAGGPVRTLGNSDYDFWYGQTRASWQSIVAHVLGIL
jgi:hypothetical protein